MNRTRQGIDGEFAQPHARLAEEQAVLKRIATLVAAELSPDELFVKVAEETATLLGRGMSALMRDNGDGTGSAVAFWGPAGATQLIGTRIPLDEDSASAKVIREKRPVRVEPYVGVAGSITERMYELGVRATVACPIIVSGSIWGVLSVASMEGEPSPPPNTEERLVEVADLLAIAIANAESREALARMADEQAALRRVAELIARESSPVEIFHAVSEEAQRVMDCEAAGLLRFDVGGATLVAQSDTPWDPPPLGTNFTLDGDNVVTHVVRTGRAARVDDWADATGAVAAMATVLGVRSAVATPIVVEGRLWGTMIAATSQSVPLPGETESRLGQFAGLVATAIANAEARGEVERLAEEQAALRRVAELVAHGVTRERVFHAVASEVGVLFGCEIGEVLMFEDDGTVTVVGSTAGPNEVGKRHTSDRGYGVHTIRETGRSVRFDTEDPFAAGMPAFVRSLGIRSAVASPIVVEGEVWGAITAVSLDGTLALGVEHRLNDFTALVATAVANTQARQQLTTLADEQAALRRVATLVAEECSLADVMAGVAEELANVLGEVVWALGRDDGDGLATLVAVSDNGPRPAGSRLTIEAGSALGRAIIEGQPARIDDFSAETGSIAQIAREQGIQSAASCPIVVRGRTWGALSVGWRKPGALPAQTETLVARFSDLVATAIANAEARAQVERLADEQAALRRVATLVAEGGSSAELFSAVAREVARVLDVRGVIVDRFEADGSQVTLGSAYDLELAGADAFMRVGVRLQLHPGTLAAAVFETHRPARIEDCSKLAGVMGEAARGAGLGSGCAAPIIVDGRLWGQMCVFSAQGTALPAGMENQLGEFVELVATAISNYDARASLAMVADEQAALRRVATLVARGVTPEEVFGAVATEVSGLFGSDVSAIVRFEEDGTATVLGDVGGPHVAGARVTLDPGYVVHEVRETGRSARFDTEDPSVADTGTLVKSFGVRSAVASPIVVQGELWGAITAVSRHGSLAPGAERRLTDFTELVATAVANTEAREEVTTLAEEQAGLRRVAELVAREAPQTEIVSAIADEIGRLTGAPVLRMLRFQGDAACVVAASSQRKDVFPVGSLLPLGGNKATSRVFETEKPVRIDDYREATGPMAETVKAAGLASVVATPILVEGRRWGVMVVATHGDEPSPLPRETESRLGQFTDLMATAIANSEARAEIERLAEEQAALRRVATLVAGGVPPTEIFTAVSREVERIVGLDEASTDRVAVIRFDPGPESVVVGAAKDDPEEPVGLRWKPKQLYVSTKVLETGRSARIDAQEVDAAGGPDAEALRRRNIYCQVGSPIVVEGRLWGAVTLNTRELLPADTEDRLERFTELVATAIANAESRNELAASRRRIVAASDETRRRIERNLHDGTQQRLISLGLALRAAQANLPSEREDLRDELDRVVGGLSGAIEDLQEISRGIHPAILSKGGLGPALQVLAQRSAIPVDLDLRLDMRLPEPIEAAAYFIVSEALANAAKHSQAARIDVALERRARSLLLSVRDDGVGGVDTARGSGLVGLIDRVEALGGSIRIDGRPRNGTQIRAELPLELEPPQPLG